MGFGRVGEAVGGAVGGSGPLCHMDPYPCQCPAILHQHSPERQGIFSLWADTFGKIQFLQLVFVQKKHVHQLRPHGAGGRGRPLDAGSGPGMADRAPGRGGGMCRCSNLISPCIGRVTKNGKDNRKTWAAQRSLELDAPLCVPARVHECHQTCFSDEDAEPREG